MGVDITIRTVLGIKLNITRDLLWGKLSADFQGDEDRFDFYEAVHEFQEQHGFYIATNFGEYDSPVVVHLHEHDVIETDGKYPDDTDCGSITGWDMIANDISGELHDKIILAGLEPGGSLGVHVIVDFT